MTTHAYPERPARRSLMQGWVIAALAVIVLAAALGAGVLIGRSTKSVTAAPAPAAPNVALADAATVQMIDAMNEAASTDGQRFASFFTKDGVMDEVNIGEVTTGRAGIARHQQDYIDSGFSARRVGPVVQSGLYVAHAGHIGPYDTDSLIVVYELTPEGKVAHMWAIAG